MAEAPKSALPSLETALKDLEKFTDQYEVSTAKLNNLQIEINNLEVQKQALKADVNDYKRLIAYYENLQIDFTSKTESTLVSQNQGQLVASKNKEKVKQVEANLAKSTIPLNVFESSTSKITNEDLLTEKTELEQIIVNNNKAMQELLHKFHSKN